MPKIRGTSEERTCLLDTNKLKYNSLKEKQNSPEIKRDVNKTNITYSKGTLDNEHTRIYTFKK